MRTKRATKDSESLTKQSIEVVVISDPRKNFVEVTHGNYVDDMPGSWLPGNTEKGDLLRITVEIVSG